MSDDVRALLERVLPDPTPFSPHEQEQALNRGRRRVRFQRMSTAGAGLAGVAVLAVGVAVVPSALAGGAPAPVASLPFGSAVTSSPNPSPTPTPTPTATSEGDGSITSAETTESSFVGDQATADRLTDVLRTAMAEQLPGATFEADPGRNWPAFEVRTVPDYYLAGAGVTDASGYGSVTVVVEPATQDAGCDGPTDPANGPDTCETGTGPNGEKWSFETDRYNERLIYNLIVTKPDGSYVQLIAENTTSVQVAEAPAMRPTPPMTKEQMLAVALNSGMHL